MQQSFQRNGCAALKLDCTKDVAFCVGIELKENEPFSKDATDMSDVLTKHLGLNVDNVKISITSALTSNANSDCTKSGILTSFEECAKKVERGGNFIFYFSGHGDMQNGCNLVTSDYSMNNGISGDDLVQCLKYAECKASNIIFIFDCCHAGSLGESLTCHEEWNIAAKLFVMCACAASERSLSGGALENSVFTYFLLDFFSTSDCKKEFEFEQAANDISALCNALSSLMLTCSYQAKDNTWGSFQFNPMAMMKKVPNLVNEVMVSNEKPIIASLELFMAGDKSIKTNLATAVQKWLRNDKTKALLKTLSVKASYAELLQSAIVSALLASSTLVYYKAADNLLDKQLLGKRNIFLGIAMEVSNHIDFFKVKIDHVKMGLRYYAGYVHTIEEHAKIEIDDSELLSLFNEMKI